MAMKTPLPILPSGREETGLVNPRERRKQQDDASNHDP